MKQDLQTLIRKVEVKFLNATNAEMLGSANDGPIHQSNIPLTTNF